MDIDPEIERALVARNKIAAIKRYRTLTGAGLRNSKNVVDEYERRLLELGRIAPESAATRRTRVLVAGIYAVAVVLGLLLALVFVLADEAARHIQGKVIDASVRTVGIAGGLLVALAIFGITLLAGRYFARASKPGPN
jgi:hypothetical protein